MTTDVGRVIRTLRPLRRMVCAGSLHRTRGRLGRSWCHPFWPGRAESPDDSSKHRRRSSEEGKRLLNGASLAKHIRPVRPGRRKMCAAGWPRIAAMQRWRWVKAKKVGRLALGGLHGAASIGLSADGIHYFRSCRILKSYTAAETVRAGRSVLQEPEP